MSAVRREAKQYDLMVGVVVVDDVSAEAWAAARYLLSRTERSSAAGMRTVLLERSYVAAHALKRLMLTAAVDHCVDPQIWSFRTSRTGKPEVEQDTDIGFNISHSAGVAACAVGRNLAIGVDIERVTARAFSHLPQRYFTPPEARTLGSLPNEQRRELFFRAWVAKEALLKADGSGITGVGKTSAADYRSTLSATATSEAPDSRRWKLWQWRGIPQFELALACDVGAKIPCVRAEVVNLNALIARLGRQRLPSLKTGNDRREAVDPASRMTFCDGR